MTELSDGQRATLRSVCDTVVPSIEHADDADGFWARSATDLHVDAQLEQLLLTMPAEQQAGLGELLDGLAAQGFATASQRSREQLLRNIALLGPEAASGVGALTGLTLFLAYGAPDPRHGAQPQLDRVRLPGSDHGPAGRAQARSLRWFPRATR